MTLEEAQEVLKIFSETISKKVPQQTPPGKLFIACQMMVARIKDDYGQDGADDLLAAALLQFGTDWAETH